MFLQSIGGRCNEYRACVQCQVFRSGELTEEECANCTFTPIEKDVVEGKEQNTTSLRGAADNFTKGKISKKISDFKNIFPMQLVAICILFQGFDIFKQLFFESFICANGISD